MKHPDLNSALRVRAAAEPDRATFTFLDHQEQPTTWTLGALDRHATRVAAALAPLVDRNDRVLIVLPSGLDFLAAFFGSMRAGAIAVPTWPPDPARLQRTLPRLLAIFDDCAPRVVLTLRAFVDGRALLGELAPRLAAVPWLAIEDLPDDDRAPAVPLADVAFLQYTSGSTSAPKGVRITHGNLRAQLDNFEERHGFGRDTRHVSWLPVQHDLGLISMLLPPVWSGGVVTFMAPGTFLRRPATWLRAISAGRGTMTGGPDFGFALAAARVREEEKQGLDLSCLTMAGVCAEFVRARTLDAFTRAFAPCGFRPAAYHPCYGLAEATLQVTGDYPLAGARRLCVDPARLREGAVVARDEGQAVVSCGPPLCGMSVRIVGPDGALGEDAVGEIWIDGPHVASGYWSRPDVFQDGAPTGDLGFLHDGELYIVGRVKDVIILAGTNYHPQDIEEAIAGCHPAIRPDQIAAFALETDEGERLGVYVEVGADDATVPDAIRRAVALNFDLPVEVIGLLPPRTLPRTSSGKLQRHACARAWGTDTLPFLRVSALPAVSSARSRVLARLQALAGALRGVAPERIDPNVPLVSLGFDSLLALDLQARVEAAFERDLPLTGFLGDATLASVAEALTLEAAPHLARPAPARPDPMAADAAFPQTEMQRAYVFGTDGGLPLGGVGYLFYEERRPGRVDLAALERAWREVLGTHAMLRAVLLPDGTQRVLDDLSAWSMPVREVSSLDDPAVRATRARLLAARVDLTRGPLFALEASRAPDGEALVHLSIALVVCDGASLRRVLADWAALALGRPVTPASLGFRDYLRAVQGDEDSPAMQRARAFWLDKLDRLPPAPALPLACPLVEVGPDAARARFEMSLRAEPWERFKARAARAGLTPTQALCATLADVLATWSSAPDFTLNLTAFNRERVHPDVDRLVGEFAATVLVEVYDRDGSFVDRARRLRDRLVENLAHARFSGVRVLGELSRRRGLTLMPVVFTSLLGLRADPDDDARVERALGPATFTRTQTPQVLLDHIVYERDGALFASWDIVEGAFAPGVVAAMWCAWRAHLERLAADEPAWSALRRDLLPPAQRAVRDRVNATEGPVPAGCLHDPVFAHARRRPDDVAVVSAGQRLRYGELAAHAQGLADHLRRAPDAPPVGVLVAKGWRQAVAVLGVLRAGRAVLPLDVEAPDARNRQVLDLAGADELVVVGAPPEALAGVRALDLDAIAPRAPDGDGDYARGDGGLPAAVIYTSGTTGEPKGVVLGHRGLVHVVRASVEHFGIREDDAFFGLTGLHHDLSLFDLFGALSVGARLVLPDAAHLRDPARWLDLLAHERVTVWNSVPAWMEMLLVHVARAGHGETLGLRVVILGGDWISVDLPRRLAALAPRSALHSIGGPTETSIWNIWHAVGELDPACPSVPYGRPVPNTRYYVFDHRREDRPDHVPGELWCSGVGLAVGYHRAPALTAAAFQPHPVTGERLYRTGDLGRYHPDGTLEFLGRSDSQVKVGGVRVELGECEATLARHPEVAGAVVLASEPAPGSPRALYAWVVPVDPALASPSREAAIERARRELERFSTDAPAVVLPGAAEPTVEPARRTTRAFRAEAVSLRRLASLLAVLRTHARGAIPRRAYPSAGSLHPVRVLVHARRVDGLASGVWLYDPHAHRLVRVAAGDTFDPRWHYPHNRTLAAEAAFSLALVADLGAIRPVYGDLARDLCLLEAGYIGQCLTEQAARSGLGLCPIGALDVPAGRALYVLAPDDELVHSFEGGEARGEDPEGDPRRRFVASLRAWLASRLPAAMVPARIGLLAALPLSANGKVDRARLARALPSSRAETVAVTPTERAVVDVMRVELGVTSLDPEASFFELGADSVRLVAAAAALSQRLGRSLPASALFQHPTARALVAWIDARAPNEEGARVPATEPRSGLLAELTRAFSVHLPRASAPPADDRPLVSFGLDALGLARFLADVAARHPESAARLRSASWRALTLRSLAQIVTGVDDPRAAIVLIPPLGCAPDAWDPLRAHLTQYRVVALDAPELPAGPAPMRAWGRRIGEILDGAEIDRPAHLVGWSFGSNLALSAALAEPARVASVMMVCPAARPPDAPDLRALPVLLSRAKEAVDAETRDRPALRAAFSAAAGIGVDQARALLTFDAPAEARGLTAPLLVVAGGDDPVRVEEHLAALRARCARFEVVEGAGHLLAATHPERLAALLRDFVREA